MSSDISAGVRVNPFRVAIEALMEKAEAWDRDYAASSPSVQALDPLPGPAAKPKPAKQVVVPERIVHRGSLIERTATGWYIPKGARNSTTDVVFHHRYLIAPLESAPAQVRRSYDEKFPREPDERNMSPQARRRILKEADRERANRARWGKA